jgi:hypothetical protein
LLKVGGHGAIYFACMRGGVTTKSRYHAVHTFRTLFESLGEELKKRDAFMNSSKQFTFSKKMAEAGSIVYSASIINEVGGRS